MKLCHFLTLVVLAFAARVEAQPTGSPPTPVRYVITSIVVAPGDTSGNGWDGGRLSPTETQSMNSALDGARSAAMSAIGSAGGPWGALLSAAPAIVSMFRAFNDAPDVYVVVHVDHAAAHRTASVPNNFRPTWAGQVVEVPLHNSQTDVDFHVWDDDGGRDTEIGICTLRGFPELDGHGYVRPTSLRCEGQILALGVRAVRPQSVARPGTEPTAPSAPSAGAGEVAPEAPPPSAPRAPAAPSAISEEEFAPLLARLRDEALDRHRVSAVQDMAVGRRHFSCDQAARMMRTATVDSYRVEIGVALYPRVVDPDNFHLLTATFTTSSYADELRTRVRR